MDPIISKNALSHFKPVEIVESLIKLKDLGQLGHLSLSQPNQPNQPFTATSTNITQDIAQARGQHFLSLLKRKRAAVFRCPLIRFRIGRIRGSVFGIYPFALIPYDGVTDMGIAGRPGCFDLPQIRASRH